MSEHIIHPGYEITDDGTIYVYGHNVLIDQTVINRANAVKRLMAGHPPPRSCDKITDEV